jgi:hypothetical protein
VGKETLLKTVIQAIPTYIMSVFLISKALCSEINSLMQRLWWGHKENDKRIHWMSWSKIRIPKSKGGMGFQDITSFNKALLATQIWRMWKSLNTQVAQIMRAKYHPNCSILVALISKKPYFAWRSIQSASGLIHDGLIWRIGNGDKVQIWQDKWILMPLTFKVQSPPAILSSMATVGELIDKDLKVWNKGLLENIFSKEERKLILSLPISHTGQEDVQLWRGTYTGTFTVRSAYHMHKHKERELLERVGGSVQRKQRRSRKTYRGCEVRTSKRISFGEPAMIFCLPVRSFLCKK